MNTKRFTLLAFVGLFSASIANGQSDITKLNGTKISAADATKFAEKTFSENKIMGAQVAVLVRGKLVWTYAYGLRNADAKLPMTTETNIWAASITKSVFASWVMKLVEEKKLNLDQSISSMLTKPLNEYEAYKDVSDDLVKDQNWKLVTPRTLLSHTAGFSNLAFLAEPDKKLRLHFKPGARYAYSGEGLNLLQFVIEEKLGETIDVSMQRDIFGPIGMNGTGMVWKDSFGANTALRYNAFAKHIGTTRRSRARGAGSMTTNVIDLAKYMEAVLSNKVLKPASVSQMLKNQITITSAHQFPSLDLTQGTEGTKVGLSYGLGWGLLTRTPYGPAFFKEGHGDGAQTYMICFPKSGTCMIILTNCDNGEFAFRPLLETIIGNTFTPWEWEGYTREAILKNDEHKPPI
jgi:CubicO group peptidase (beta-lactamase class C family)